MIFFSSFPGSQKVGRFQKTKSKGLTIGIQVPFTVVKGSVFSQIGSKKFKNCPRTR